MDTPLLETRVSIELSANRAIYFAGAARYTADDLEAEDRARGNTDEDELVSVAELGECIEGVLETVLASIGEEMKRRVSEEEADPVALVAQLGEEMEAATAMLLRRNR